MNNNNNNNNNNHIIVISLLYIFFEQKHTPSPADGSKTSAVKLLYHFACHIAVPFCGTKTSKDPPSLIRRLASGITVQGGGLRIGLSETHSVAGRWPRRRAEHIIKQ